MKKENFLKKIFNQIVTDEIKANCDYYSTCECNSENEYGSIYTELRVGTEKVWINLKYFDGKERYIIGFIEYWNRNEEGIETASKAICEISKNLLKFWYN